MLQILKRELNVSIITSIVYVILGIVIVSNPEATLSIVGTTIAILAILYGIIVSIINIANIKEESRLIFGILLIVLGIALLIYPSSLSVLISLGIGIWYITSSVTRIKYSVLLKDIPEMNWVVLLVGAIITLIIGITFVFAPLASAVALTTFSGIMMIIYSVIDIVEVVFIKKNMKEIEEVWK